MENLLMGLAYLASFFFALAVVTAVIEGVACLMGKNHRKRIPKPQTRYFVG